MKRSSTYEAVHDGEWMHLPRHGLHLACCDCHLVHDLMAKVDKNGRILIRVKRHNRATAALRRTLKFTKEDD